MSHLKPSPDVTPVAHVTLETGGSDVTLGTPDVTSRASRCDIAMSPEPLEPPVEPPGAPKPRSRKKVETEIDPDFEITESTWEWCRQQSYSRQLVERQRKAFVLSAQANGRRYKDWQAAFRMWLTNCEERGWGQVKETARGYPIA